MFVCRRIPPFIAARLKTGLPHATSAELGAKIASHVRPSTTSAFYAQSHWVHDSPTGVSAAGRAQPEVDSIDVKAHEAPIEQKTTPTVADFEEGLQTALEHKQYSIADVLLQQLVNIYRTDTASRFTIFHDFIRRDDLDSFDRATLASVLDLLRTSPYELQHLAASDVVRILTQPGVDPEVFDPGFECLLGHLSEIRAPSGFYAIDYTPPESIRHSFALLRMLPGDRPEKAMRLFDVLVENAFIPAEALPTEDAIDTADIKFVVLASLARASLHWNWYTLTSDCVVDLLDPKAKEDPFVLPLANDTLSGILDGAAERYLPDSLEGCRTIIQRLHPIQPAPDEVLEKFYDVAYRLRQGRVAERLYDFCRQDSVSEEHYYSGPTGFALGWFMVYISKNTHRVDLIRTLATEVMHRRIHLLPQVRAKFIEVTASAGNAGPARKLWERYSLGPNAYAITGDPALLVPMVRLFSNLIKSMTRKLEERGKSPPGSQPGGLQERIQSMQTFLNKVIKAFERHHSPIENASHRVVTTYAQACFAAGQTETGFKLMQNLLKRNEIPDIYDVNVSLNGLGKKNPRAAAELLEDVVRTRGLVPDVTSYGTVMSRALDHHDFELVDKMVAKMKTLDIERFTLKSVTNLLRAMTVERPKEPFKKRAARVRSALSIAKAWLGKNRTTSTQVARDLVNASIQVDEPAVAFQFWEMMVRRALQWDGAEHQEMRRRIAREIEGHVQKGRMSREKAKGMLCTLSRRST